MLNPATETTPRFLSTDEAAEMLRIKTQTLRVWRWRGDGPRYLKAGSRVLYKLADVLTWLEQTSAQSTSEVQA